MSILRRIYYLALLSVFAQSINAHTSLLQMATSFCPYTNFCSQNASRQLQDEFIPSCQTCLCGELCLKYGRCCPDAQADKRHDNYSVLYSSTGNCRSQLVKKKISGFSENVHKMKYMYYRIVDNCENAEYSEEKTLCGEGNHTTLGEVVWVSHKANGKIFKNRFCALCNNIDESELIPWNIQTSCNAELFQTFDKMVEVLMSDRCEIIVKVPEEIQHLVAIYEFHCVKIGYSRCNETGKWRDYDDVIVDACEIFDWPFIDWPVQVHKNVFCLACNVNDSTKIPTVYNSDASVRVVYPRFVILLAYDVQSLERGVKMADKACGSGEIMDKYTMSCRSLLCPFGSLPKLGQCKTIAIQASLSVAFYLKLLPYPPVPWDLPNSTSFQTDATAQWISEIYGKFHDLLGFKTAKCYSCSYRLWVDREEEILRGFVVSADITTGTNPLCSTEFVLRQISSITGRNVAVTDGNYSVFLHVDLETRPFDIINQNLTAVKADNYFCGRDQPNFYRLRETRMCPMVELNYGEASLLPKRTSKRFRSLFGKDTQSDSGSNVTACLDDYNSFMAKSNVATCIWCDVKLLLAVVLSVVQCFINCW